MSTTVMFKDSNGSIAIDVIGENLSLEDFNATVIEPLLKARGYDVDSEKNKKREAYRKSLISVVESYSGLVECLVEISMHVKKKDGSPTRSAKKALRALEDFMGIMEDDNPGVKVEV